MNDTLNTKVQRCWVTPSQPSEVYGGWRWRRGYEKAKVKVRKQEWKGGNYSNKQSTWHVNLQFFFRTQKDAIKLPSLSSALTVVCSHRCLLSPSSRPSTGLTWCLPAALNYGVQRIVHWLWRQWRLSSTANVCARPVTHEFGLRTIPFGYLRSTNRVQSYRVSLDQYTAFFWTTVVCAQPVTLEFGLRTIPSGYDQVSLLLLFSGLHSYFL